MPLISIGCQHWINASYQHWLSALVQCLVSALVVSIGSMPYQHAPRSPAHVLPTQQEEFHSENVRKIQDLYKYDCLRANKSTMAWGVEAR